MLVLALWLFKLFKFESACKFGKLLKDSKVGKFSTGYIAPLILKLVGALGAVKLVGATGLFGVIKFIGFVKFAIKLPPLLNTSIR